MKVPLVRVVGMLFVAMILSLSLVVTTPTTAHALRVGPAIPPQIVGAVKTIAPAALTVASFTPPGFALRVIGTLGFLAFSTSDIWMPYVTGLFGNPPTDVNASTTDYKVAPGYRISNATVPGANPEKIQWTLNITSPWTTKTTTTNVTDVQCRNGAGVVSAGTSAVDSVTLALADSGSPRSKTVCPVGSTVTAAKIGPPAITASFPGPENILTYGAVGGFDPRGADVRYKGRSECIDASGVLSWVEAEESRGDAGGIVMPSCAAQGKGHGTGRTQVIGFKPDGSTQTLWDIPSAPSDPATPLCDPGKAATTGCTLTVEIDGKGCEAGNVECENWSEVNNNDPNKNTSSARVKCKLGPYTVPISQCALLEQAFLPGGAPATEQNVDGDPATRNWSDLHGNPIAPTAPSITPIPGAVPGTGGSPGPGADSEAKECFPAGWSMLNPVEWVLKPVGCALEAAFVPDPTKVQTRTATITNKMQNVGFQRVTTAWLTTFEAVGGSSGCAGPTVNFDWHGVHQTIQPFNACSPPMSGVAAVSYAVSSIIMVLFGGLSVARAIAAGFGFNFSMGRGGDA